MSIYERLEFALLKITTLREMVPFKARAIDFLVIRKLRMKLDLAKVDTFVGRLRRPHSEHCCASRFFSCLSF